MGELADVVGGLKLVKEAYQSFQEDKQNGTEFVTPYLVYFAGDEPEAMELDAFTDAAVLKALNKVLPKTNSFVLAGESEVVHPKTKIKEHFFVAKLYLKGLSEAYVYSVHFKSENEDFAALRYVGSEPNALLPVEKSAGEESSVNAIQMEDKFPFDIRTAFLIGHMDERCLWNDFKTFVADMYCKVGLNTKQRYEFVFEISKFGRMTTSMKEEFDFIKLYFDQQFAPKFTHIKAELKLENTKL